MMEGKQTEKIHVYYKRYQEDMLCRKNNLMEKS
jgi:hypothetical protein